MTPPSLTRPKTVRIAPPAHHQQYEYLQEEEEQEGVPFPPKRVGEKDWAYHARLKSHGFQQSEIDAEISRLKDLEAAAKRDAQAKSGTASTAYGAPVLRRMLPPKAAMSKSTASRGSAIRSLAIPQAALEKELLALLVSTGNAKLDYNKLRTGLAKRQGELNQLGIKSENLCTNSIETLQEYATLLLGHLSQASKK